MKAWHTSCTVTAGSLARLVPELVGMACLALTLTFGQVAFAGTGWGDAANGDGYYHESNDGG
jgi:hypothetical protein